MRGRMFLMMTVTAALVVVVAGPGLACETGMWITSDPGSGPPGTDVTVRGGGWEPGSVTLRWDRSAESGGAVLGEALVGPDGTISAQVTIPEGAPGRHMIVAEHTQAAGEVTHAGDWSYFTIPGAAPAQEQPRPNEQQQPQQAERPERPPADTREPAASGDASSRTAAVEIPSETVAEPSVASPAEAPVAVAEQQPASKPRTAQLPIAEGPGLEIGRDPAMIDPVPTEIAEAPAKEQPAKEPEANPLSWWLAAAVAAVLLPLMTRRLRSSPPRNADVLDLPFPVSTAQEEERKAA